MYTPRIQVELKFFHEREARAVDVFYVFCGKSERKSESFALGPTTGTENDKRRTLRKSITGREDSCFSLLAMVTR